MPRRKQVKRGRPAGSEDMVTNVEGSTFLYLKPFQQGGAWRCRRRERSTGKVSCITVSDVDTVADAVAAVRRRAEAEARAASEAAKPPAERPPLSITLEQAKAEWLDAYQKKHLPKKGTMDTERGIWKTVLAAKVAGRDKPLGQLFVHELTTADLDKFLTGLDKLAARTRVAYAVSLRRFFAHAVMYNWTKSNPLAGWEIPRAWHKATRAAARETGQALNADEMRHLLAKAWQRYAVDNKPIKFRKEGEERELSERAPPGHLHLIVATALLSGLRRGSILSLEWGNLDLTDGVECFKLRGDQMKAGLPFTPPMNHQLAVLFREERARLGRVPRDGEKIFGIVDFKHPWQSLVKRAGMKDRKLRFHDCRHSYMGQLGRIAPFFVCQKLAAHSGDGTTARYAQRFEDEPLLRRYLDMLPDITGKVTAHEKLSPVSAKA